MPISLGVTMISYGHCKSFSNVYRGAIREAIRARPSHAKLWFSVKTDKGQSGDDITAITVGVGSVASRRNRQLIAWSATPMIRRDLILSVVLKVNRHSDIWKCLEITINSAFFTFNLLFGECNLLCSRKLPLLKLSGLFSLLRLSKIKQCTMLL